MTETQATAPNGRWLVWVWRDSSGVDEITGPLDGDPAPFYYDWRSSGAPSIQSNPISRAHMRATCAPFAIGANRTLANFKTFFRWCVERVLLERSPADLVRAPSIEVSRDRVLSDEEIRAIWKAALTCAGPYGRIVRLLLLTAQRRDEVAGMRRDELDLKSRSWTLRANRTKSGRLHVVPLSEVAIFNVCSVPRVGPLLFGSQADPLGDRTCSCWNQAKLRLDKASGVSDWRLHDHRRAAATGMARLGISPPVIERVLNHAVTSAGPLAAVYQRYDYAKEKREALELWASEVVRLVRL